MLSVVLALVLMFVAGVCVGVGVAYILPAHPLRNLFNFGIGRKFIHFPR